MHTITLQTGELSIGKSSEIINSGPLGSCIAIIIFSKNITLAGMAHIMMPGRYTKTNRLDENKFAETAIDNLLDLLMRNGGKMIDFSCCVIGASNVLKRPDDTICASNIASVLGYLEKKNIPVLKKDLGGEEHRTVTLDLVKGEIRRSLGDRKEEIFYTFDL